MSAHAAPASTITLPQILALGSQCRHWAFVPIARQALPQTASDPELWFLLVANLADLGLRTLAREELDALCERRPQALRLPHVTKLIDRLESLPEDRIPRDELLANAAAARDALAERDIDLSNAFEHWAAKLPNTEAFRATDGNIVRRAGGTLLHLGDQIGAAEQIGAEHIAQACQSPAPFLIEGVDPPWLLIELARRTPRLDSGYQPGIRVVQADAHEFFDGCALSNISAILREERVECFVGDHASDRLTVALRRDAGTPIAGPYMPLRSLRTLLTPSVNDAVQHALTEQDAEHREHLNRVHLRDAERSEAWWRTRLVSAIEGQGEPLRVLIATCRFTTVLGSMASDLAQSLRKQGCQVELLIEPSDHRRLSPLAYSRLLDRFDPDVILAPNYTRRDLEKVITGSAEPPPESRVLPVGVPFVVWVQDAMPHLLRASAGASIGPLDLTLGYITSEMITQFGYPRDSLVAAPLPASTDKFDASRIDPALREQFACDVAMITHHSETPDALRDRLLTELSGSPVVRRMASDLIPSLDQIARNAMNPPGIACAVRTLMQKQSSLDSESREVLIQNFAMRYVDRVLRHEAAHWCANICERRGWSFRIFGKNWESHPALARYASPPLTHGDELAAAYNAAGITLHISAIGTFHQRLIECALSGGVPVLRRTFAADAAARRHSMLRIVQNHAPEEITDPADGFGRVLWYDYLTSAETARYTSLMQRHGMRVKDRIAIRDPDSDPRLAHFPPMTPESDAAWLMGGLDEASFANADELESLIERARMYPHWRTSLSNGAAMRARRFHTHDTLASKLVQSLRARAG